ncbi:HAMP domain-containing histidine kinase [Pseudonocardia sp. RS11V-5]|uniref:sensor histidine kinase n=1 Tax=Pseudonocardia terrae TaxID=2905831 RepID=UPI001E5FF001|nr:HAMP domain-containing sensor histidine kinase [Pseudonocardia terrae]MCE3554210.1 HAMP domain-containing histidine kinase [Pseudonocardia terrae]
MTARMRLRTRGRDAGRTAGRPAGEVVLARRAAVRLGVQAAALAAALVVLLTTAAVVVLIEAQKSQVTAQLDGAIARADDVDDPPAGTFLVLRTPDGRVTETSGLPAGVMDRNALDEATAGGHPPAVERNVDHTQYEISTLHRADGTTVQAILDLTANHAERNRLLSTMLMTGVVGLVAAGAVGTWLGHRALGPLSAALTLQRRFVADAGHELRTPLTLLGTRAQLLRRRLRRDPDADPRLLTETEGVVTDAARLTAILEDLLLAADPLADRPCEPVDLVALCRDVLDAAAAGAATHQVELRLTAPRTVQVEGSAAALHRAVTALVDNAAHHAHRLVSVAVTTDDDAVVEVHDDGDGVDPALAPRLFDRFTTSARHAESGRRRYGLGLALVAEIAAVHRGRVELVELVEADEGATFRLTLPIAAVHDLRAPGTEAAPDPAGPPRNL